MEYFRIKMNKNGIASQGLLSIDGRTDHCYHISVIGICGDHWEINHYSQSIGSDLSPCIIEEVSESIYKEALANAKHNRLTCTTIEDFIDFQQRMENYDAKKRMAH